MTLHAVLMVVGLSLMFDGCAVEALSGAAGRSNPRLSVPTGDFLAGDDSGHLVVLDRRGNDVRRIAPAVAAYAAQGIELSADRRHAFVSLLQGDRLPRLYEVDLANGHKRQIARAISPALSPDRTRLAYLSSGRRKHGIVELVGLVIRDLRTGLSHSIPFAKAVPLGTPPELVINWSPDARAVALVAGPGIRLVDVAIAHDVDSQRSLPGDTATTPRDTPSLAPVFLDGHTLVVLSNCCVGRQQLVALDLRSGAKTPFAWLSSPAEQLRRLKTGLLLCVTAERELILVSKGHTHVIARGITAVTD